jgi:chemotaxis protein CheX
LTARANYGLLQAVLDSYWKKGVHLGIVEGAPEGALPVGQAIRAALLEPFIEATRTTLAEMAGVEPAVAAVYQATRDHPPGDIAAMVALTSPALRTLVIAYPERTAAALAKRIMTVGAVDVDDSLIRDCVGEIANVVAGQAKALLAATPYRFVFALPKVVAGAGALEDEADVDCLVIAFDSACGRFALRLSVQKPTGQADMDGIV